MAGPLSAYDPAAWSDFCVAVAGAAAAFGGLLFVAVSINLTRILASPGLPARAGGTLIMLLLPLMVAVLLLVPEQPRVALAVELLLVALAVLAALGWLNRPASASAEEPPYSWLLARFLPSILSGGFTVVAGATLWAGAGGGLYWLAPAVFLTFLAGIGNAWVLLVEIQR